MSRNRDFSLHFVILPDNVFFKHNLSCLKNLFSSDSTEWLFLKSSIKDSKLKGRYKEASNSHRTICEDVISNLPTEMERSSMHSGECPLQVLKQMA